MKKSTLIKIGYFTITLLLGFIIGFYVNRQLTHQRLNHLRKSFNKPGMEMKMLAKSLKLTPEQVEEMRPILRKHLPVQLSTRKRHKSEMDSLRTAMFNDIQPYLTNQQLEKVERIKKQPRPHLRRRPMP